jgi:hypothetical protein
VSGSSRFDEALTQLRQNGQGSGLADHYGVTYNDKGKPVLPELPPHDDPGAQCWWTTNVLNLDRAHAVIRAEQQGLSGDVAHVELIRLDAPSIRFEPASVLTSAAKLTNALIWQLQASDGTPHPWTNGQAVIVARIIRLLCSTVTTMTATDETQAFVVNLTQAAEQLPGRTGTSSERYEAALSLKPPEDGNGRQIGVRYLIDQDNGETIVRVSDLAQIARKITGGSLTRGWLDARMQAIGWRRTRLDGHGMPRTPEEVLGHHAHCDVYRGTLPEPKNA